MTTDLHTCFALCSPGLDGVLRKELKRLDGVTVVDDKSIAGRVAFSVDSGTLYQALLRLRCSDRVLLEIARFPAPTFDALFEGVRAVDWKRFVGPKDGIVVDKVRIKDSALQSQVSVQGMAHKAVCDALQQAYGYERVPEDKEPRELRIYLDADECVLALDLCGEPLSKRGYRKDSVDAPLRETVAAALLFMSGWNRSKPLYDPFCGSGTFAIEAALYALNVAPGLKRRFSMESMPLFSDAETKQRFAEEVAKAEAEIKTDAVVRIAGSDRDPAAIEAAKANAARAGVAQRIAFDIKDLDACRAPYEWTEGLVIANPPFGNRLGDVKEAHLVWSSMRGLLERFPEWDFATIADDDAFPQWFGIQAHRTRPMINGGAKQWFFWYPHDAPRLSAPSPREGASDDDGTPFEASFRGKGVPPRQSRDARGGDRPRYNRDGQGGDRPRFNRDGQGGDRPRYNRDGQGGDRPRFNRDGQGGDRPRYNRDEHSGDRPRFTRDEHSGDRPRYNRDGQGGDRPRYNRDGQGGDRPRFNRDGQGGDRPRYNRDEHSGDRPRFTRDEHGGDRPRYNRDEQGGDRPRYNRDGQGGDRPRYNRDEHGGDRPRYNRDEQGGDRPRFNRDGQGGDRPRFNRDGQGGDRPRYNRDEHGGDRPRFNRDGQGGDRPRYNRDEHGGDRPRFNRDGQGGDRPRYNRDGQGGDRPRYNRDEPGGDRPRFNRDGQGGDRPRYNRDGQGGDRPRYNRDGQGGDRPRYNRDGQGGDRPRFSRDGQGGDRPRFNRDGQGEGSSDDRGSKRFERGPDGRWKPAGDSDNREKMPWMRNKDEGSDAPPKE
jgi:putative N6-adenine-specific DNA methylase